MAPAISARRSQPTFSGNSVQIQLGDQFVRKNSTFLHQKLMFVGDLMCKIFGVPVVKHGINGHLRQKGKVAELACGYSGSVGAMKAMGGAEMSDTELKQIVTDWRTASPHIVQLWWDVENAAIKAVRDKTETQFDTARLTV